MRSCAAESANHDRLSALAEWIQRDANVLGLTNLSRSSDVVAATSGSARALRIVLDGAPIGSWADIGAGSAAFGLSIAILFPSASVALIDRRERAICFADVAARRLGVANAVARCADLEDLPASHYVGVVFRAVGTPRSVLFAAARVARHYVAAVHSPAATEYDTPPQEYALAARAGIEETDLFLTLYRRSSAPNSRQE